MKLSKRMLCALVVVVFTLVNLFTVPAFADFTDLKEGDKAFQAVSVLNKLGIINGYEDGSFKPDNNVTRAEFTAMLLRTRGLGTLGSTDLANPPFPDVSTSDVSWAIGNIRTAREMKIINGYEDGTFRPNNNVSYEEATKMIVCALGYENFGAPGTEWYSKYIMAANNLGFLDGAGGSIGTPATRATIAIMLYNCLEVELAENNEITEKTVLESDLKLTKKIGYIASNAETSLTEPDSNLKENEIQINAPSDNGLAYTTLTYKVDNADEYKDMLGAQITFYYQDDKANDIRTVVLATVKKTETVTIDAGDIEPSSCTSTSIAYYKDENASKVSTLKISDESIVVYNGKLYGSSESNSSFADYYATESDPIPTIGSLKLLDRDGDGSYDIIFVDKYEAYVASSVTSSNYTITDNVLAGQGGKKVELHPDADYEVEIVDTDGNTLSFSSIKKGSVVCVKESNAANGGTVKKVAVVNNKTVNGTVKSVSKGKGLKIDSTEYEYSEQAPWILGTYTGADALTEPTMSDSGLFYLDMNGDVLAYDKTETSSNQQYGYIMRAIHKTDKMEETLAFNIITSNGSKTIYYAYEDTKVNGQTFGTYDAIMDELEATAVRDNAYSSEDTDNTTYSQLVKFTTTTRKGSTVVDEIITVTDESELLDKGKTVTNDTLNYLTAIAGSDSVTYSASGSQFKTSGGSVVNVTSAVIISIPENRHDVDEYKIVSKNSLTTSKSYNIECYDVSGTNSAKIILLYSGSQKSGEVIATSPVMLVTEIGRTTNEANNNESMYQLKGYVGASEVTYWGSPDSDSVFADVQEGDIIRLGQDNDGFYTLKEEHIIFGIDIDRSEVIITDDNNDEYTVSELNGAYIDTRDETSSSESKNSYATPEYRVIWGSAYARDDDELLNVSAELLTGDEDVTSQSSIYSIPFSKFNNAKIFRYETGASLTIREVDKEKEPVADVLNGLALQGDDPAEIFLHMSNGSVKTMVIVER